MTRDKRVAYLGDTVHADFMPYSCIQFNTYQVHFRMLL